MTLTHRKSAPPEPDADLARRASRGDRDALGELYHRRAGMLTRLAARLLASRSDAEDVVQDLFVGLPEALKRYRETGRFDAWLRALVINLALKRLRSGRRRLAWFASQPHSSPLNAGNDAGEVRRAVEALPPGLRAVVVLKIIEGYGHAEIAELLGISRGTSEVRLLRALRKLRQMLGD